MTVVFILTRIRTNVNIPWQAPWVFQDMVAEWMSDKRILQCIHIETRDGYEWIRRMTFNTREDFLSWSQHRDVVKERYAMNIYDANNGIWTNLNLSESPMETTP